MAEIVLDHVSKRYPDGVEAVRDFSLRVADGEFIILVGPSGCGKSTTLNMIAGLEDITSGEIRVDGKRVNEVAPRDRDMAMVFQSYALYPHMTVRENIGFPLKLARADKGTITRKVEQTAAILDLTPHLDRKPGALSGGQRQRVAMGRAIVRSPKAFLMDEPLSNLDAKLRVQMRTSISRIQKQLNATTVYVTHDQTEAMTLGDRIVIMRAGAIQQIGAPQEVYDEPANLFVAGFIGSPAMNFLPARISDGSLETALGRVPLSGCQLRALERRSGEPRECIVGIRPESFEDAALAGREGVTFVATVDILESMGSEKFAYFKLDNAGTKNEPLAQLSRDAGWEDARQDQIIAKIDARSEAREGARLNVWLDSERMHLFDPRTGESLSGPRPLV